MGGAKGEDGGLPCNLDGSSFKTVTFTLFHPSIFLRDCVLTLSCFFYFCG